MSDSFFKSDFHTHTLHSRHSDPNMSIRNSLAQGERAKLYLQLVLEHVPLIYSQIGSVKDWYKGKNRRTPFDLLLKEFAELPENSPAPAKILLGMEMDADPFLMNGEGMIDDFTGVDLVLGSTHITPDGKNFWYERPALTDSEKKYTAHRWRDWVVAFIASDKIDILSHPADMIGAMNLYPPFDRDETLRFFEPILQQLKASSVCFELNELLGHKFTKEYKESYPSLVKLAKEIGVTFSIGSDAHRPADTGKFIWVRELVASYSLSQDQLFDETKMKKRNR